MIHPKSECITDRTLDSYRRRLTGDWGDVRRPATLRKCEHRITLKTLKEIQTQNLHVVIISWEKSPHLVSPRMKTI